MSMPSRSTFRRPRISQARRLERLEHELSRLVREKRPGIVLRELRRTPRLVRSSWAVEDLRLSLSDGTRVSLVWKDLDREAPGSRAHTVKPRHVSDPRREIWVYETLLRGVGEGPVCWGSVSDEADGVHWLFLEPVPGSPLCEVGGHAAWLDAAAWLGRFHARFGKAPPGSSLLLRHDRRLHGKWYDSAVALARGPDGHASHPQAPTPGAGSPPPAGVAPERLKRLVDIREPHLEAMESVLETQSTLLHGEYYPANILVDDSGPTRRIRPVDWEMAGVGPAVLDLAALTSGAWSEPERTMLTVAYRDARLAAGGACPAVESLVRLTEAARLLLAVQWLGWSGDAWRPPADLYTDWLEEAVRCADRLTA